MAVGNDGEIRASGGFHVELKCALLLYAGVTLSSLDGRDQKGS